MTDKEFKYNHCLKKRKYNSIKEAKNVIKRAKKTGIIITPYNIYRCKYCNNYHIGHKKILTKSL